MIWLLVACAGEELPTDSYDRCADLPVTTWDNFGAGFVTQSCQTCHSSTSPNRLGAPEDVTFDDAEQVWAQADRVLQRVVTDADMPPQGGVTEEDRRRLDIWLTCGDEGT